MGMHGRRGGESGRLFRLQLAFGVLITGLFPVSRSAELSRLRILGPNYPRVFYFRAAERAFDRRLYPTYARWEADFDGLMGIMGKCLDEECRGRLRRNPAFFRRFKQRHPAQVVLLHFNGNARDPEFQRSGYFPGHWVYRRSVRLTADVPAVSGTSVIHVSDARVFRLHVGRYRRLNDDIALFRIRPDGRHDWYYCEQVRLLALDAAAGTITVERGCYGTRPLAFQKDQAGAAAHAVEGPWGRNNRLLWLYNYSLACPRDRNGRTCADVLAADLARWFGTGGVLAGFDGIEFDVLHNRVHGDTDGDGVVDDGILHGRNEYGVGVVAFVQKLRACMGKNFLILADGALGWGGKGSQRAWGVLNGIESEGWPNLNDWEFEDWSGGVNRFRFWQSHSFPPAFNYVNHKWIQEVPGQPGRVRFVRAPFSRSRLVFAAAQCLDAMLCYSMPPQGPRLRGRRLGRGRAHGLATYPVWDEFVCGREHRLGWLGRPEGPAVCLADGTPDLLAGGHGSPPVRLPGEGAQREKMRGGLWMGKIDGDVILTRVPTGVRIASRAPGNGFLRFTLHDLPARGPDLVVSLVMSAARRAGYPEEMARFVRVIASFGVIDLLAVPPVATGMCLRGRPETALDRRTGAAAVFCKRTIRGKQLPAMFVHPPWRQGTGYTYWRQDVRVPQHGELCFSLGMAEKSPARSDGVWFKVYAARFRPGGFGRYTRIFEESSKAYRWLPRRVSLERFAGQRIRLKFVADAGPHDNPTTDQASWGAVRIVRTDIPAEERTLPVQSMTWAGRRPFLSRFYFRNVRSTRINLECIVESEEPVILEAVHVHAHPDAMARVFSNGLVLANPSLHPYRFDLEAISPGRRYRRFRGTAFQDTKTNNGQAVGRFVTLGERDGLFLVRVR